MICPTCGHEVASDAIQVTPETVADQYEMWLARPNGNARMRLTEKIPVVTIKGTALRSKPTKESQAGQP